MTVSDDTNRPDDAIVAASSTSTLAGAGFATDLTGQATTAGHRIVCKRDTGNLFCDRDGTGAEAATPFARLSGGSADAAPERFRGVLMTAAAVAAGRGGPVRAMPAMPARCRSLTGVKAAIPPVSAAQSVRPARMQTISGAGSP